MVKKLFYILVGTLLAVMCSEILLRAITSKTLDNSLWFSGDLHKQDKKYGFVFSPNYQGSMRLLPEVFLVELSLDRWGHRLPAIKKDCQKTIVLIGGLSMVFGYGLRDSLTLHQKLADKLGGSVCIYNTAWPGNGTHRNFHIYKDGLGKTIEPDLVIMPFWYSSVNEVKDFGTHDEIYPNPRKFFRFKDRHEFGNPMKFTSSFGKLYYDFVLVNKIYTSYLDYSQKFGKYFSRIRGVPKKIEEPKQTLLTHSEKLKSAHFYCSSAIYMKDYFEERSTKFITIMMPKGGFPLNLYEEHLACLDEGIQNFDLHREIGGTLNDWIAFGHYGSKSMDKIAEKIAEAIRPLIQ